MLLVQCWIYLFSSSYSYYILQDFWSLWKFSCDKLLTNIYVAKVCWSSNAFSFHVQCQTSDATSEILIFCNSNLSKKKFTKEKETLGITLNWQGLSNYHSTSSKFRVWKNRLMSKSKIGPLLISLYYTSIIIPWPMCRWEQYGVWVQNNPLWNHPRSGRKSDTRCWVPRPVHGVPLMDFLHGEHPIRLVGPSVNF